MHILMICDSLLSDNREDNPASLIHLHYWKNGGHQVTVLTYQSKVQTHHKNLDRFTKSPNCTVIHLGADRKSGKCGIQKLLQKGNFIVRTLMAGLNIKKCDLIIGIAPPFTIGYIGLALAKLRSIPYIAEIHPTVHSNGGLFVKIGRKIVRFLKEFLLIHSDHLVLSNEESPVDLSRFPNKPWTSIPVGLNILKYRQLLSAGDNSIVMEKGLFKVAYLGEFTRENNLDTIILAAKTLQELNDLHYYLVGSGIHREFLEHRIKIEKISNISLYGGQSKIDILQIVEQMDIILLMGEKTIFESPTIPCGLLESMAMEKPIIIGMQGRAQQMVAQSNAGIVIDPDSMTDLRDAILKLYNNPSLRKKLGSNGRRYVDSTFSSEDLDMSFAHLMK